jgi:hypothetical protein
MECLVGMDCIINYYIITSSIFSFNLAASAASPTISPASSVIINTPTIIPPSPTTLKLNVISEWNNVQFTAMERLV